MMIVDMAMMVMMMVIVKIKDIYHHGTFHGHHSVGNMMLLLMKLIVSLILTP